MQRTKRVARNIGATLIAQVLSWAISIVVALYLPRYLGAAGNGALTLAGSFGATFGLALGLISGTVLIREIARDRGRLSEMVSAAIALRIPLGLLVCIVGVSFAHLFAGPMHYTHRLQVLFLLSLLLILMSGVNDVLSSALRGLEEIPRQNAASLAEKFISSIATLYMVWRRDPITWILATGFLSMGVSFVVYASALRPHFKGFVRPSWSTSKELIGASAPFMTTYLFMTIYSQCDPMLLDRMSNLTNIGWYGLAKKLGGTALFAPVAIAGAMLPTLSRLYHEDERLFDHVVRRFVGYMFLLVVPFASIFIFAPGPLLRLMHYPPSFLGSIPVLTVLGFSIILWYLSQAAGTALIASDGQKVLSRVTGYAAVMAVPLCAAFIWFTQSRWHNGAIGAMASDAVVELYLVSAYIRALPRGCVTGQQFMTLLKATVAAIPIVAPLYVFHSGRWSLLSTIPGLAAFLPICYLFRCIGPEDIDLVRSAFARKTMPSQSEATDAPIAGGSDIGQDGGLSASVGMTSAEQIAAAAEATG